MSIILIILLISIVFIVSFFSDDLFDTIIKLVFISFIVVIIALIHFVIYDEPLLNNLFNIEKEKNVENSYDKCYNDLISKMYDNETAEKLCEIQIENG